MSVRMFFSKWVVSIAVVTLLISSIVFAQGGPPLSTDDPGTPGDGHWEINSAAQWALTNQATTLQLPLFDINYGYGDHIQLNLNTSFINVDQRSVGKLSGISLASTGVKWRFVDEKVFGVAISTYPRIDFHHGLSSNDPNVNSPGNRYFLPIEFSKEFGKFGVNPELGYASYTQAPSEWVYGLATSYTFEKDKEVLFELHGRSLIGTADRELFYNFGFRYFLIEHLSAIGAIGKTFLAYADTPLSWNIYAGVQLRL